MAILLGFCIMGVYQEPFSREHFASWCSQYDKGAAYLKTAVLA